MAMTITITDSTSSCTFLASTSSVQGSSASYDDANHKATLNWNDTATSTVSLAKDPETGEYITDSLMLNVIWGGRYRQAVVVVHKDAYACRWKVGSTTLSASTPSVTINGNVSVTATPLKNSAEVPTVSATEVAISNYWISGVSPDGTKSGSWNYPATIKRGDSSIPTDYPYLISWKKPASSNRIMGYLVIEWKGWSSATPIYLSAGAMQFVAPETTAFTLDSQWWSGAEGTWLKHTVFTVYDKGIYPAISTVNDATNGDNVTERNKDTIKPYSIYAKFGTPPTLYTVSFYDDSGNYIKVENKDYTYTTVSGAKVVAPTGSSWIPTGYKLDGWYRKDGSGSWGTTLLSTAEVNNISVNSSDISFKAKFSLNVFTVTWKNWNGNVLETDTNVAYGSTPSYDGSTPTRATSGGYSYAFSSWSPTPVAVTANATYTAQFTATAIKYTVSYNSNGGSSVSSQDYYVTTNLSLRAAPTRDGYTFNGWKVTSASGTWTSGDTYTSAQNVGTGKYGNVTLTAQWTANTYKLIFNLNTTNCPPNLTNPSDISINYNSTYPTLDTEHNNPAWDTAHDTGEWDYEFDGWYLGSSSTVYAAGQTYTTVGNQTWNAKWTKTHKRYDITWVDYDDTVLETDTSVEYGTTPTYDGAVLHRNGYTWAGRTAGWTPVISTVTGTATYKAVYNKIIYSIEYDYRDNDTYIKFATVNTLNNPRTSYDVETATFTIGNPTTTPDGYRFDGWTATLSKHSSDVNTPVAPTSWSTPSTSFRVTKGTWGNINLTANWTARVYTVSFDTNLNEAEDQGTQSPVEKPDDRQVTFADKYSVPTLSRDGYTFDGWYTEPDGGIKITNNTDKTTAQSETLYAHWTIITRTLHFVTNGGSEVDDVVLTIEESYPYYIIQTTSKLNNVFVGWFDSSDNLVTKINSWPSSDITLYAKFIPQLTPFEPKPDKPGVNPQNPNDDNDNYGIPVEDLDSSLQYRLVLTVKGDRENGTHGEPDGQGDVFTMPSGTGSITRDSNNRWVWSYDTGIVSKQDLYYKDDDGVVHGLMTQTIFTMNVWRVQVYNSTAVLDVTLEAYDDGNSLGSSETHNEFEIGDEYVPYVSKEDSGINSDVLLLEGIDSIRALDLYNAIGSSQDLINADSYEDIKQLIYTRRFIGNSRSTVVVRIKAHSKNFDRNSELYEKEVLYGAVPCYITVRLDGDGYDSGYVNEVVDFNPNDEDNHVYVSPEITVDTHPFPNIVHSSPNDFVSGRFRIKVYDSRHYHVN